MMWIIYVLAGVGLLTIVTIGGVLVAAWLRPAEVPYIDSDGLPRLD